jgi:hypothetical protein
MKIQYRFAKLSKDEREFLQLVLMEEMDIQRWFAVAWSSLLGVEVLLTLQ